MEPRRLPELVEAQNLISLARGYHLPQVEVMVCLPHSFCNYVSSFIAAFQFYVFYLISFFNIKNTSRRRLSEHQ